MNEYTPASRFALSPTGGDGAYPECAIWMDLANDRGRSRRRDLAKVGDLGQKSENQ